MKKLIKLARPFTLAHTVVIALMYCLIAGFDFQKTIIATLALVSIHASAQMTNLLKDVAIDMINKPWRPTVTGEVKKIRAIVFVGICLKLSIFLAYLVSEFFFYMMLVLWFFSWSFSLLPVRKNQFTHVFWMATTRGFIPAFMITQNFALSVLMFFWNFAFNPVKDWRDVKGDLAHGIKTVANQYGEKGLKMWCKAWGSVFYVSLAVFVLIGLMPIKCLIAIFTLPLLFAIPEMLDESPAFSDNTMAYDLYWFGFTLNSVFFAVAFTL